MCVAVRTTSKLQRLIEYLDPIRREVVFDLFFDASGASGDVSITFLHKGNVAVSLETESLFAPDLESVHDRMLHEVSAQTRAIHDAKPGGSRQGAGGLACEWKGDEILLGSAPAGVDDRPKFLKLVPEPIVDHCSEKKLTRALDENGIEFPSDAHLAFTMWRVEKLPATKFALRFKVKMSKETGNRLIGDPKDGSSQSFWIDGDAILVHEAETELQTVDADTGTGAVTKKILGDLIEEFHALPFVAPRIFEYVEVRAEDHRTPRFTPRTYSVNTFTQEVSSDLDADRLNWLVMTPDFGEVSPYERFQVRFLQAELAVS